MYLYYLNVHYTKKNASIKNCLQKDSLGNLKRFSMALQIVLKLFFSNFHFFVVQISFQIKFVPNLHISSIYFIAGRVVSDLEVFI